MEHFHVNLVQTLIEIRNLKQEKEIPVNLLWQNKEMMVSISSQHLAAQS